ncbi:MAG TPA: 23S rRNA pseudouridine(1911/1915/1917) synthase RluD [Steroidobacteraceae bacterium]|nr:23S rRNA pseudouridine(1911/1915/1917) synthase RluD [Steroidobacteraceae bacterium]
MSQYSQLANPPISKLDLTVTEEFRTHEITLPQALEGLRLDQALARALPAYSRARLRSWIDMGAVRVEGRIPRARDKVLGGEHVRIEARLPTESTVSPEKLPVDVVFADDAIFVINKPAGVVVHPGAGNRAHTLQNALLALDPGLAQVPRAGLVHRLDRDTSGLLVVARTLEAHTRLVAALAARQIERRYQAICVGVMTGGRTVDEPIGRHRTLRTRMAVRSDGRPAVTHLRVVRRFRAHTLVEATLETGRTHQIRVHLAHIGYPIVGDPVYGGRRRIPPASGPALLAALDSFKRQALHALRLKLAHPESGELMEWEAPLPRDMCQLIAALDEDLRRAGGTRMRSRRRP